MEVEKGQENDDLRRKKARRDLVKSKVANRKARLRKHR